MVRPLEGLALSTLSDDVLVKKLAAIWCAHYGNCAPTSGGDILDWVIEEFGEVLPKTKYKPVRFALGAEVKRQLAIRRRRRARQPEEDYLELSPLDGLRQKRLLENILGPSRRWVSPLRTGPGAYNNFCITSGLVAAIIPTKISLRRLRSPSLMVFRQTGDVVRSYWVPGDYTSIADVLVWLIPQKLQASIKSGLVRVEHDGKHKRVRANWNDGRVTYHPWRKVR